MNNPLDIRAHTHAGGPPGGRSGGGSPIGKILLGCGCLTLFIGGVVIAVVIFGGLFAAKKVADSEEFVEVKNLAKSLEEEAQRQKEREARKAEAIRAARARGEDPDAQADAELSLEDLSKWPTEPLTRAEISAHVAFMDEWEGSEAARKLKKTQKELKKLSEKKGAEGNTLEGLKALNATKDFVIGAGAANEELEIVAIKHGGAQKVLKRYFKVVAVAAAARGVANEYELGEESSDEVARRMLEEHPTWKERHVKWRAASKEHYELLAEQQSDPSKMAELAKSKEYQERVKEYSKFAKHQTSSPGLLLLGKLPEASLETWKKLGAKQRRDLIETYSRVPFIPIFAVAPDDLRDLDMVATHLVGLEVAQIAREAGFGQAPKGAKP